MISKDRNSVGATAPDSEELAAQVFARRRFGAWDSVDESGLKVRIEQDAGFANAYRRVEQSWTAVGHHATSAELMGLREQAIARARRASARRWATDDRGQRRVLRIAAGIAALGMVLAAAYHLAPFGLRSGEYRTGIGEQRSIELDDRTRIALDAATRLRVRFSKDSRIVELLQGQAQFSVAKDSARPFKVEAGDHTVVAVGTIFNVEYVEGEMQVAMLEGKVAVLSPDTGNPRPMGTEETLLTSGAALRVTRQGQTTVTPQADLEAVTAWHQHKVILHSEPLSQAVRRLNRYSRLQLQVDDPKLVSMNISGVFDAGDTAAFVEAVESYLPVVAEHIDADTIRFRLR